MNIHHSNSKDVPYYPMRYFRRQVVAWMIKHCQLVMANKGVALKANYGLEEEDGQFKGHFLTNSIYSMYSSTTSGEMRSSSML